MASKSKRRRKVLGASCILAALIIAGSSFAWFTSKDEVTNRLSATANYGVTIAEDFQPPENWVPGQTVDKNVGVVNTGNVDAFVRTWLEGEMRLLNQTTTPTAAWGTGAFTIDSKNIATDLNKADSFINIQDTTDAAFAKMNLTKQYTNATNKKTTYFKSLSAKAQDNPQNSTNNSESNPANGTKYSEVQATQAGGILAYAPDNAEYEYILNQDTWMRVVTGTTETKYTNVPKDTRVVVVATPAAANAVSLSTDGQSIETFVTVDGTNTVYVPAQTSAANFVPVNIDSETFKPLTPGLYLFARNVNMTEEANAAITADYEFGGYYYSDFDTVPTYSNSNVSFGHNPKDDKDTPSTTKGEFGQGTYYALKYDEDGNSDYSVLGTTYTTGTAPATTQVSAKVDPATGELLLVQPTANLELFTATQTVSENTEFNWKYIGKTEKYKVYENATPAGGTLKKKYYVFDSKVYNSVEDIKKDKVSTDTTDGSTTVTSAYLTGSYSEGAETAVNGTADMIYASKDDIIVDIELANINNAPDANHAETWKVLSGSPNEYTFYYNNDVEEGDTTARLVESVKLDESITKDDYMAFDFDLNVKMESVQVTYDANGAESVDPANAEFKAGDAPVKITSVTGTNTGDEITSIAWSNA